MSAGPRWAIESYVGAGPVRLGDTVESIADAVHAEPEFIDKGGPLPTAVFADLGLHAPRLITAAKPSS